MIDLIKAATLTNDPSVQKNAESTLLKHREEQPEQFFLDNANIFNNRSIDISVRQSAGTLLTVSLKTKNNNGYLWYSMTPPNRSAFKDMVLNTMIDPEKVIRRAAANIVAAICCIELPNNQWPGIIQKITRNIENQDPIVKEVSILTVGFVCEQLKQSTFAFEEAQQETIFAGICTGIKDSHPHIVETAFKALRDGLPAMGTIMKNDQYKQYLLSQLIESINQGNFADYSLQAMLEFVKLYFSLLHGQYFTAIANATFPTLSNPKNESTCIVAMELWSVIARQQTNIESNPNMNKYITGQLGQKLVQILLENLCFVEEDDDEANGISQGAALALESIFTDDSKQYEQKILTFTTNTIHNENWKYRQASIRAFSLLLLGLPEEQSQILVNRSLLELVALLQDKVQYVQLSAIKSLSLITQEVPEVILNHKHFLDILSFVVKMGSSEIYLKHVCKIVDNLTGSPSSIQKVGPHSEDMIKVFLEILLAPNRANNIISQIFNVIINLIKCSCNIGLCNNYIDYVLKTYPSIHNLEREKRDLFYSGFLTIAQICLMTIRKSNGSITMDQLSTLYNLVVEHYKRINDVDGDGFYLVSALAFFIPNDRRLIDDFWKYIQHGLKKTNQDDVFRATVSCICDFAATYREQISDKVDPIINQIIQLYKENYISRDLKLDVLMCIGQLFLQCGDICYKHVKTVMNLLFVSCEGALSITDLNYAQSLQEAIIETEMCIMHGISDPRFEADVPGYMPYIVEFIRLTTDKAKRPKLEYVQNCMMLLADISQLYPKERDGLIKEAFIRDRTATLNQFNKNGQLTQTITFVKQQFKVNL